MQNHTHRLQLSLYIRTLLQCDHIFMTRYAKLQTQITVIIDTSEQCYNAAISSWRDMQNHTHIDLARRSSILLAGRRSCCTWSLNKLHLCWWLKQWSLDTGWNCSFWCQEVLGHLPRTQLRGRSMSREFFSQLCETIEAIWPKGGGWIGLHTEFKLFLRKHCQTPEPPRLFSDEAASENKLRTSGNC
jgi:hypothetical protein